MAFTYFFRDMQTLEMIRDYALPLLSGRQYIKVWDAGCAMGQEPYSLAVVLRENMGYMYFRNVKITASDIDNSDLFEKIISDGNYPRVQVERIPDNLLEKYFLPDEGKNSFTLIDEIRKSVKYVKHDLLSLKEVDGNFGLVICKNVLLHFSLEQRIDVIRMFYNSLSEGGFLAMEQTQKLPDEVADLFEPVVSNAQLYKKITK